MSGKRVRSEGEGRLEARRRLALLILGASVAAMVVTILTAAPGLRLHGAPWLAVIAVLALIADRSRVPLPSGVGFDATIALVLLAVVVAGPPGALVVFAAPWLADAATRRRPALRVSALGDLSLYGWQAIAAALVLRDAPPGAAALPWLVLAGVAQYVVGWAAGPAIYGTLWVGSPLRSLSRALVDMAPAATATIVLGAVTVVLADALGVAALALFAVIVLLPQSALTYAARTRPVARLDRATATRRYAHALAVELGLSRAERRHIAAVAVIARRHPPSDDPVEYVLATLRDRSPANLDAQVLTEWWDGRGGPLGLRGPGIPVAARVLAVAATWSALTARDTPQLAHSAALDDLEVAAGARLDPEIVGAARAVIAQERVTAAEPAPEPRLHRLRVPAPLRRALAAG
jgi:hypothetical protein